MSPITLQLRTLPVSVAAGLFLIVPPAGARPQTASPEECQEQATIGELDGKEAKGGTSAPQAVSHDLRTNVVARTNTSAPPAAPSTSASDAHAISTKGTGTSGRPASGGGCDADCDGLENDVAGKHAISTEGTGAAGRTEGTCLAIKTKGTSAK